MKFLHWAIAGVLLLLIVLTAAAVFFTRANGSRWGRSRPTAAIPLPDIDLTPLKTARALASFATTPEELELSRAAERIADHSVDLAFANALRQASSHPVDPQGKNHELYLRVQKAQATLAEENAQLTQFKTRLAAAKPGETELLEQQVALLDAQQALDQDELDDAQQELLRAGANPQGAIERLREEHEAAEHQDGTAQTAPQASPVDLKAPHLVGQVRAWSWLKSKQTALETAQHDALDLSKTLVAQHDQLASRVSAQEPERQEVRQRARELPDLTEAHGRTREVAAATLTTLQRFADDQKLLAGFAKQIEDEQDLARSYGNWLDFTASQERSVLHDVLRSTLRILVVIFLVYLGSRLTDRYFTGVAPEKKRVFTLRTIVRIALYAVALALILLIVLGGFSGAPTVLGLIGAGLAFALRDPLAGVLGWFVLMGRNGIRVGDWVEINGVVGEVLEIGVLRTVMLETGNWTDSGHPTGRKVAFVNSFALVGHFFNFSTTGQWLWDELQVLMPTGQNPYPLMAAIQKLVEEETHTDATRAEAEWQKSVGHYNLQPMSMAPAIHLRPTVFGVELQVRYITSANERYAMRARLYEKVVGILRLEPRPQSA